MLTSKDRILTTHTGSLPRPAALTELYARRAEGETIDRHVGGARIHDHHINDTIELSDGALKVFNPLAIARL